VWRPSGPLPESAAAAALPGSAAAAAVAARVRGGLWAAAGVRCGCNEGRGIMIIMMICPAEMALRRLLAACKVSKL